MTTNGPSYVSLIGMHKPQLVVERNTQMETTMKYAKLDLGTIEAIVNKLGGMDGVKRFLAGELTVSAVEWTKKIWNRIKVGTFKNVDEIRKALKKANVNVSEWANDILNKVVVSVTKEEFDLVNVSPAELGFKGNTSRKDIYEMALKSGLELCSAEDGPQAVLQFGGQLRNGEWFVIGMEPITGSGGNLGVFYVERYGDGELWLYARSGYPGNVWDADFRFVFRRRR